MLVGNTPVADATERALLAALASILIRGEFVTDDLDALVTVENDPNADDGVRRFARHAIEWLAQQSGRRELPVFNLASDVQH